MVALRRTVSSIQRPPKYTVEEPLLEKPHPSSKLPEITITYGTCRVALRQDGTTHVFGSDGEESDNITLNGRLTEQFESDLRKLAGDDPKVRIFLASLLVS